MQLLDELPLALQKSLSITLCLTELIGEVQGFDTGFDLQDMLKLSTCRPRAYLNECYGKGVPDKEELVGRRIVQLRNIKHLVPQQELRGAV